MFLSEMIGLLIAEMVKHGDVDVKLDQVMNYRTNIRGFYIVTDEEFGTKTLMIEPVDR